MKDSKFLRFYSTFSVEEAKEWIKFVESPYFNKDQNVVALAKILRKYHSNLDHKAIDKKRLFAKIYGEEIYSDGKMRKLMSAAVRLIERFWVVRGVEGDDIKYADTLLEALRDHDLNDAYFKKAEWLIGQVTKDVDSDYGYLSNLHLDVFGDKGVARKKDYMHHVKDSAMFSRAQYYARSVTLALVALNEYNIGHKVSNWIYEIDFVDEPPILSRDYGYQIMKRLYQLWIGHEQIPKEKLYALWQKFVEQSGYINSGYRSNFTALVFNYSKNSTNINYYSESFRNEVFYWGLENKAFLYKNKIGPLTVYAFCQELCQQGLASKAHEVLLDYGPYLPIEVRRNSIKLCTGLIDFFEKKFEDSYYNLISFSAFKLDRIEIVRRALLLRVGLEYSMISENMDLEGEINNYTKYIRRNRNLAKSQLGLFLNYANLIYRSYRYLKSTSKKNNTRDRILKDVHQNTLISLDTKNWFERILKK